MSLAQRSQDQDVADDAATVRAAVRLLVPHWQLPEQIAGAALGDIAEDLGVDVVYLARLVVASHVPNGTTTG